MGSLYFLNIRHLHLQELRDILYSGTMYKTGSHGDISDLCYFFFPSLLRSEPSKCWRGRLRAGRRSGEPAPDTLSSHCSAASRGCTKGRIYFAAMGSLVWQHTRAARASPECNTFLIKTQGMPVLFSLDQECSTPAMT